jgi:hypothetical protein
MSFVTQNIQLNTLSQKKPRLLNQISIEVQPDIIVEEQKKHIEIGLNNLFYTIIKNIL